MNCATFTCLFTCPRCGERLKAETASLLGTDYRQHLAKEHGMRREIVPLRHDG